ncbi:ABC transporter transmembrane domain-containing protein [Streptomyces cirratus]
MPVAFFTRTRTGALVSRLNNDVIGAQRAFSNTLSGVASNIVTLLLTLAVMLGISWQITLLALVLLPVFVLPAPADGDADASMQREASAAQRRHGHPDDGTVLRARRHFGQAVRTPLGGVRRVRGAGGPGAGHRHPHGHGPVRVHHRPHPGLRPGPRAGLRPRRLLRRARDPGSGLRRRPRPAAHPALLAADRPGRGPCRGDERDGQLRARLRDPRPGAADRREARRAAGAGRGRWRWSSTGSPSATPPPTRSRSPPWRKSPPSTRGAAPRCCTTSPSAPSPAR